MWKWGRQESGRRRAKIVLHAGFPKTGTSSLQSYLSRHRLELEQNGIVYPQFDERDSHWLLTAAFHDSPENYHHVQRRIATGGVSNQLNAAKSKLNSLLATVKDDRVVILSHEGIGGNLKGARGVSELRDTLLGFTDHLHVVAYARNPVELYPSYIQQRLKGLEKRVTPPDDWVSDHAARAEHLRSIFGEERCEIRIYSPSTLLNGDIIDDFAHYLFKTTGKQLPLSLSRGRRNTSICAPACAILFALKLGVVGALESTTFKALRKQLILFSATRTDPKLAVPPEWNRMIASKHADAWNRLMEQASCSAENRTAHLLPNGMDHQAVLYPEEFQAWLLGCGSREYNLAFADFCEASNAIRH